MKYSISHKAYYYFKYLHLPGEGTRWLPAGEINGVSFQAGTLSLVKNEERHGSSCSVHCRKHVQISKAEHKFKRSYLLHTLGYTFFFLFFLFPFWSERTSSEHKKEGLPG